ncbi:MAG: hypothetical protein QM783_13500 [Phycisphaerales bacterium]
MSEARVLLVQLPPRPPSRAAIWTPITAAAFIFCVAGVVAWVIIAMGGGIPHIGLDVTLAAVAIYTCVSIARRRSAEWTEHRQAVESARSMSDAQRRQLPDALLASQLLLLHGAHANNLEAILLQSLEELERGLGRKLPRAWIDDVEDHRLPLDQWPAPGSVRLHTPMAGWRYALLVVICAVFVIALCMVLAAVISHFTGNGRPSFWIGTVVPMFFATIALAAGGLVWRGLAAKRGRVEFDRQSATLLRPFSSPLHYPRDRVLLIYTLADEPSLTGEGRRHFPLGWLLCEGLPTVAFLPPQSLTTQTARAPH